MFGVLVLAGGVSAADSVRTLEPMADASVCGKCGGSVRPTGARSRGCFGTGADDEISWRAWTETGVCTSCGAVHRRVAELAGAAWRATGMVAAGLALGGRELAVAGNVHSRAVLSGEATVTTLGTEVKVPPGGAVAGGISPTERVAPSPVDGHPLALRWGSEKLPAARRRRATDADYQRVFVPIAVGLGVFGVLAESGSDPETAAIWAVAAIAMTALSMRELPLSILIAWLSDRLKPPNE